MVWAAYQTAEDRDHEDAAGKKQKRCTAGDRSDDDGIGWVRKKRLAAASLLNCSFVPGDCP